MIECRRLNKKRYYSRLDVYSNILEANQAIGVGL
jgi:hypothetical protein